MKITPARRPSPLRLLLLSACSVPIAAACKDHGSSEVTVVTETIPAYLESEPNDDETSANDFGVLYPGDLFVIEGHSTDDGSDPFDGFSFVAGGPLHVDFRLFDPPYSADLDVWLYDPQLGEVVGYFETENHPESGGVDVVQAGLEFHLLVTSYWGRGDYELELEVSTLAPAALAAGAAPGIGPSRGSVLASGATPIAAPAQRPRRLAPEDYRSAPTSRPLASVTWSHDEEGGLSVLVVERHARPQAP